MRYQDVVFHRFKFQKRLFKKFTPIITGIYHTFGIVNMPRLWCSPINHYKLDKNKKIVFDLDKQSQHLQFISKKVGGHLINGSTGDGWTTSIDDKLKIVKMTFDTMNQVSCNKRPVMLGCLHKTIDGTMKIIDGYIDYMQSYYNINTTDELITDSIFKEDVNDKKCSPFVGFCITPENDNDNQRELLQGIEAILDKYIDWPFVLYQVPSLTNSYIEPHIFEILCDRYPNLIMLKDTTTDDKILKNGTNLKGLYTIKSTEHNIIETLLPKQNGFVSYNAVMTRNSNYLPNMIEDILYNLCELNNVPKSLQLATQVNNFITAVNDHNIDLNAQAKALVPTIADHINAFGPTNTTNLPVLYNGKQITINEITKIWDEMTKHLDGYQPELYFKI